MPPVVARPRPGREEEKDLCAVAAPDVVTLVRLEVHERPGPSVEPLAPRADLGDPVDDDDPGVLLHLVVAELLARVKVDEDGARLGLAEEDDGIGCSSGGRDLAQLPRLHGERVYLGVAPG